MITIASIQSRTARRFGIPIIEMTSKRRAREVARPRQIAMYLSKRLTPHSLPTIGHFFGDRDHTTVIHAVRTVERLSAADPALDREIRLAMLDVLAPEAEADSGCQHQKHVGAPNFALGDSVGGGA